MKTKVIKFCTYHPNRKQSCRSMCKSCYDRWLRHNNNDYRLLKLRIKKNLYHKNKPKPIRIKNPVVNNEKICSKCLLKLNILEFYKNKTNEIRSWCKSCYKKHYHNKSEDKKIADHLKRYFNLTLEEYNNMLLKQNLVCAICNQPESTKKKRLSVDHSHINNKIRGLLCSSCNSGIGYFKDNIENMQNAINYLGRTQ